MRILIAVLAILFLFLQFRLWVGEGSLAEVNNLKQEIARQEQALAGLRERNRRLQAEVDDLRSRQGGDRGACPQRTGHDQVRRDLLPSDPERRGGCE